MKKVDAFIYLFSHVYSDSFFLQDIAAALLPTLRREVCCVVVKLLLKHQPLFGSLCGAFAATTAGETSQCLPVAIERLSYLFWMTQLHTMKDPPAQVDSSGTEAREVVEFQRKRGR